MTSSPREKQPETPVGLLCGTIRFLGRPALFEGETPSFRGSLSRLKNRTWNVQTAPQPSHANCVDTGLQPMPNCSTCWYP